MPLPILAIMAAATAVSGAAKASAGRKEKQAGEADAAALLKKRKGYQTPAELYKILNASEQNAQSGFDPATLGYLTSQTDRAFDSSLDASKYLGGDPNDFAGLFDQKMNAIMKIGAENHQQNLANFNAYIGALGTIASSKDAEFVSGQNMIKDQQQNAQARVASGAAEQANGTNMIISAASSYAQSKINEDAAANGTKAATVVAPTVSPSTTAAVPAATTATTSSVASNNDGYYDEGTGTWKNWDGTPWLRKK